MRYLIFSDSHGYTSDMEDIIARHTCDTVIHLGDVAADAEHLRRVFFAKAICAVAGNNDWRDHSLPEELILKDGGFHMLLCHGHKYHVKQSAAFLQQRAKQKECAAALFGHTHSPVIAQDANILLFNPGSVTFGGTYGVLSVDSGNVTAQLLDKRNDEIIMQKAFEITPRSKN